MKIFIIIENGKEFAKTLKRALSVFFNNNIVIKKKTYEDLQSDLEEEAGKDRIIILETEFGKGANLLESLRRDLHLLAPVIILSLMKLERLRKKYPIVQKGVPGSYFIKTPLNLKELKKVLEVAEGLSSEQLKNVVLKYCHIGDSLRITLHDTMNAIRAGEADKAKRLFQCLKRELYFLPGRFNAEMKKVDEMLGDGEMIDRETLSNLLFEIQERLYEEQGEGMPSAKPEDFIMRFAQLPSPKGSEYILIVDDDGYDFSSIERLEEKGYSVELITSHEEALYKLEYDPPDILLCDWRLEGNPKYGEEIAQKALNTKKTKLVILISADEIENPPKGAEICVGQDKFNAGLIHSLICKKSGL